MIDMSCIPERGVALHSVRCKNYCHLYVCVFRYQRVPQSIRTGVLLTLYTYKSRLETFSREFSNFYYDVFV